jgi:exodeoxyribonuclease V gamma subunit
MEELNQGFLFFSNQLESLLTLMSNDIFTCSTPFTTRMIVVPSPEMGDWVKRKFAEEKGVACGIEIFYLNTVVQTLLESLFEPHSFSKIPSRFELVLSLKHEIELLSKEEHPFTPPLLNYLQGREEKVMELAMTLSTLFMQYALYAPEAVAKWEQSPQNWQELLWSRLFKEEWSHLGKIFHTLHFKNEIPDVRLALFSFSHLPKLLFHFFEKVSKKIPTALYHLSPCKEFWSDFLSSKEQKGVEGLDLFIEQQHPFLANLGKVGREFAKLMEESTWEPNEVYIAPKKESALIEFQQGLLNLDVSKVNWDSSLRLHCVNSKKREVDVLFSSLYEAFASGDVKPSEVLVMAPSITPYLPYIKALFEGVIPYTCADIESANEIGFFKLLAVDEARWSSLALLDLFSFPPFQEKLGWDVSELKQIERWIEQTGFRWGLDLEHRKECLPEFSGGEGGTWKEMQRQLFDELATGALAFTSCSLLEQMFDVVDSLSHVVRSLKKESLTLSQWLKEITELSQTYFVASSTEERLLKILREICQAGLQEEKFLLTMLLPLIKNERDKIQGELYRGELESVSFSSFLPLRTIPAKWVWIMGMDETTFPRTEHKHPLDRLRDVPSSYFPSCVDYDRYLFLEAVLSCRETFCISYVGMQEGEKVPPSSVVSDFLRHFQHVKESVHPSRSYDPSLFEKGGDFSSYIDSDFKLAASLTQPDEKKPVQTTHLLPPKKSFLVSELLQLAKSPLRYYLKEHQGIYFREKALPIEEETFILSPLQKWALQNESHSSPISAVKERFLRKGEYPTGTFGELADLSCEQMHIELDLEKISLDENPLKILLDEEIEIRGTLECLSHERVIVYGKKSLASVVKIWPAYLILSAIFEKQFPILFLKDSTLYQPQIKDPIESLKCFLHYALNCRKTPSYLHPDWILPIAKQEEEKLAKQIFSPHFDPALKWMEEGGRIPHPKKLISDFSEEVKKLFAEVLHDWV